ncbi:hypothetical protein QJS66_08130 [Kocuria rhizophila]|nr:hypothetical protein QJS66_08130 [Kocuria rhizophila]
MDWRAMRAARVVLPGRGGAVPRGGHVARTRGRAGAVPLPGGVRCWPRSPCGSSSPGAASAGWTCTSSRSATPPWWP